MGNLSGIKRLKHFGLEIEAFPYSVGKLKQDLESEKNMEKTKWVKQKDLNLWQPKEEGEEIEGQIISVTESKFGGFQYGIKKEDGTSVMTPSHKVLQNRLSDAKTGTMVKIVYLGLEKPKIKGYSPTAMYDVFFAE